MRRVAIAAVVLCPALALGNGRAPITNGVHFQPRDHRSLYVATTFGLLVSHDDGCSFRWICEQSIGYGGTFDPKYRIAADGTIFATTYTGLRVSRDGGCSFTTATADAPAGDPGRIADAWTDAIDIASNGDVWVVTADTARPNNVYRSTDNARSFAPRGLASPSVWWKSVAAAPSRPQRVYVTGYQVAGALADGGQSPPTTHFEISDDSGAHWRESSLTGVAFGAMPLVYVLGVDPGNPDVVMMSSSLANGAGDRLYRSTDGGASWTDVLDTRSPIVDLAFETSGTVVVATLGASASGAGPFQSTDRGASFASLVGAPQLACVGQRGDGAVFGCGANWEPDFQAVARTRDGTRWSKLFRFVELAGPLDCPAGTGEHDLCGGAWPALQQQFAATGPTACGAGALASDAIAPPAAPRKSSGCCQSSETPSATPGALGGLALLAAGVGFVLRRRRG
jgi:MYXO-CTERM domain-containing protein